MPSKEAHLAIAERNQQCIDYLKQDLSHYAEWVTTVAFYKALHLVDALLAADKDAPAAHGTDHRSRERHLKQTPRYRNIYRYYRPLAQASSIARYLEGGNTSYTMFSQYMSASEVESTILGHYLLQIEKTVGKLMPRS
jgi:hypothetical protein